MEVFSKSTLQSSSKVKRQHSKSLRHHDRPDPPAANETKLTTTSPKTKEKSSNVDDDHNDDVHTSVSSTSTPSVEQQPWRQYGYKRRQWLIENDKATSSLSFRINSACAIQKYFALAERVIAQFQELYNQNRMEDAYVMGHRLITFLGTALPRHPSYSSSILQRTMTQNHLQQIKKIMKHISIVIDEEQLNRYITNDFDPILDDDDDDDDNDDDENYKNSISKNSGQDSSDDDPNSWETFGGWSFHSDSVTPPGLADTDESSQDIDSEIDFSDFDLQKQKLRVIRTVETAIPVHHPDLTDGVPFSDDYDETDESDDSRTDPFATRMKPPVLAQSILRKIAREAVRYESDSEAADSWAQDGNCGASDATSSSEVGDAATIASSCNQNNNSPRGVGTSSGAAPFISCDPARLAFKTIMNRHTRNLQSLQVEMESLLSTNPLPSRSLQPQKQHQVFTRNSESNIQQPSHHIEEEKKEEDDQQKPDGPHDISRSKPQLDALTVALTVSLPPPVISGPQVMEPHHLTTKHVDMTMSSMASIPSPSLQPREESPFRPENRIVVPDTPHNSPDDSNRTTTTISNRWGVQLRRTMTIPNPHQESKDVSPS